MLSKVVVTGGGTGGHVFTGIAVLDEVRRRNPRARTVFVGSSAGHEVSLVPRTGHALRLIDARPLRLNGVRGAARALSRLPAAVLDALRLLRAEAPEVVLGIGGPASGPTLMAARVLGLPALLHEQNAVPGLANRLAGGFVRDVMVGLPQVRGRFVGRPGVTVTGNPVRAELLARFAEPSVRRAGDPLRVLVLGGSDGSSFLNRRLPAVLARAASIAGCRVVVRHQGGAGDKSIPERYRELALPARVVTFIRDMGAAYAEADVAVALAGAGTLAELALAGLPSLIVPLAGAADDHQRENALHFARHGAIRLVDQTLWRDEEVAGEVARLFTDVALRESLTSRFRELAMPRAAATIVDRLEHRVRP